jgi:hypothetical protein
VLSENDDGKFVGVAITKAHPLLNLEVRHPE